MDAADTIRVHRSNNTMCMYYCSKSMLDFCSSQTNSIVRSSRISGSWEMRVDLDKEADLFMAFFKYKN